MTFFASPDTPYVGKTIGRCVTYYSKFNRRFCKKTVEGSDVDMQRMLD